MTSTLKLTALAFLTLTACGTARLGKTTSYGGQVLLEGNYMPSMTEARFLMGMHCGSSYQAVEKGRAVTFQCDPSGSMPAFAVAKR